MVKPPHTPVRHDPLSDICTASGLRCTSIERWNLREPWGIRYAGSEDAIVHTMVRGRAVIVGLRPEPVVIAEGGTAVLPRNVPHVIASQWPLDEAHIYEDRPPALAGGSVVNLDPDAAATSGRDAILVTMPFEIPGRHTEELPEGTELRTAEPVKVLDEPGEELLEMLILVARLSLDPSAGARYIACRVAEAILAKALQRMAGAEEDRFGLFGLFASAGMRAAMSAVESDVGRAWTVGELADLAGMTRTRFKAEFAATVGTNVRDFIDLRRLRIAESRWWSGAGSAADVAEAVGFRSVAALRSAARKLGGLRPTAGLRDRLRD